MSRRFFIIVMAAVAALSSVACSDSGKPGPSSESEMGTVTIPLTASGAGVTYRLNSARFTITALDGSAPPLAVVAPPDEHVHQELLAPGVYSVNLESGWQLESQALGSSDPFVFVNAVLLSKNPIVVRVARSTIAEALFRFATDGPVVDFGEGVLNIRIDVDNCAGYDAITSALGTYTVACLGTIGPDAYSLDQQGLLQRNFDSCPLDKSKLQSIDDYLSVQRRPDILPLGQRCLAGRWAAWKNAFLQSGITQCPDWTLQRLVNEPTKEVIASVVPDLDKLPEEGSRTSPPFVGQLKQGALYQTSFNGEPTQQACATPGACAVQCAAGLPGFVTNAADSLVLTDPWDWDLDTVYAEGDDPFMQAGYYHPMSYVEPVPDGVFIGHRNRRGEKCSRFVNPLNIKRYVLELNCLDNMLETSCITLCNPSRAM